MPKTKGESIFFTAITAWMMVYVMTLYNTVIAMGSFTNAAFLIALKGMWIEYIIIALLAYFVSGHLAKMCAFRVVQPGDRPIFIIFSIQIFTVIWQVLFASVLGVYHGYGFTSNFLPDYLTTYCSSLQIFVRFTGPPNDNAVLSQCGLTEGQTLPFSKFTQYVQQNIIASGKRPEICGDCQWNRICQDQPSRWQNT